MKTYVVSLGGSVIFKDFRLNKRFLVDFVNYVKVLSKRAYKFIIVPGGGFFARQYIDFLKDLGKDEKSLDNIGLHVVRINALFIKELFGDLVYYKVIDDPFYRIKTNKKIIIYGGYKPGFSSDYIASACAKTYNVKTVINITNVCCLYDRDPRKSGAKPIYKITWNEFLKIAGEFHAGKHFPFDPVAASFCKRNRINVVILKGISNLKKFIDKKRFVGTLIESKD